MVQPFVSPPELPDRIDDLNTPCLLLDEGRLDDNIARLSRRLSERGVAFRPHLKTAKSVEVARRVLSHSSGPATVSTLKEAEIFAQAGVTDMIYAVGIAPAKLPRVAALRRQVRRDNQDGNPATIRMRMRRCWGDEGRA